MNATLFLIVALASPAPTHPTTAVEAAPREVLSAVERGAALLVELQESLDGTPDEDTSGDEWPYEGVYRVRGGIPIGYRIGGTAIAAWALCELPGWDERPERGEAVERATRFVLTRLDEPLMAPSFLGAYDVRGWGHAYALRFLVRLRELDRVPEGLADTVDERIVWLVEALEETEIRERGGWNYSRPKGDESNPSPFMTAATLQALFAAAATGEEVDAAVVDRALASLERARMESRAFQYAQSGRRNEEEPVQGAIGRMPLCETTLLLAGRGEVPRVRAALDDFFEHWQFLEDRRQKDKTHLPPYGIAPYYFFFAHGYAGQAIEQLDAAEREGYRKRLRAVLWKVRERDTGGWNDRVFARSENYGTAMSLLALWAPYMPEPAAWTAPAAVSEEAADESAPEAPQGG